MNVLQTNTVITHVDDTEIHAEISPIYYKAFDEDATTQAIRALLLNVKKVNFIEKSKFH
jgi:hypothetical protein